MSCDVFVLLDDVQVPQGRSYASRTRVKIPNGESAWVTVPIKKRGGPQSYSAQAILPVSDWYNRVWGGIYHNYASAPYWDYNEFEFTFGRAAESCTTLAGFNTWLIGWARKALEIDTIMTSQSAVGVHVNKRELPARLCNALGCDVYLSGQGARSYNEQGVFDLYGVGLEYQQYDPVEYDQLWGDFVPNLSIIDLIFNMGPEARDVLERSHKSVSQAETA